MMQTAAAAARGGGAFHGGRNNVTNQIYAKNYVEESLRFLREKAKEHEEGLLKNQMQGNDDDRQDGRTIGIDERENRNDESNEDKQKKKSDNLKQSSLREKKKRSKSLENNLDSIDLIDGKNVVKNGTLKYHNHHHRHHHHHHNHDTHDKTSKDTKYDSVNNTATITKSSKKQKQPLLTSNLLNLPQKTPQQAFDQLASPTQQQILLNDETVNDLTLSKTVKQLAGEIVDTGGKDMYESQRKRNYYYPKNSNHSSDMLQDYNDFLRMNIPSTYTTNTYKKRKSSTSKKQHHHSNHTHRNYTDLMDLFDDAITNENTNGDGGVYRHRAHRKTRHGSKSNEIQYVDEIQDEVVVPSTLNGVGSKYIVDKIYYVKKTRSRSKSVDSKQRDGKRHSTKRHSASPPAETHSETHDDSQFSTPKEKSDRSSNERSGAGRTHVNGSKYSSLRGSNKEQRQNGGDEDYDDIKKKSPRRESPENVEALKSQLKQLRAEVDRLQSAHITLQTQIRNKSTSILNLNEIDEKLATMHIQKQYEQQQHMSRSIPNLIEKQMYADQDDDDEQQHVMQNGYVERVQSNSAVRAQQQSIQRQQSSIIVNVNKNQSASNLVNSMSQQCETVNHRSLQQQQQLSATASTSVTQIPTTVTTSIKTEPVFELHMSDKNNSRGQSLNNLSSLSKSTMNLVDSGRVAATYVSTVTNTAQPINYELAASQSKIQSSHQQQQQYQTAFKPVLSSSQAKSQQNIFVLQQQQQQQPQQMYGHVKQTSVSPPNKPNSPNTHLYQQLLNILSNNATAPHMSESEISLLLANPKIRDQLKKLHTQLLTNPDLYLPQLEQVVLSRKAVPTETATNNNRINPSATIGAVTTTDTADGGQKKFNSVNFSSNFKKKPNTGQQPFGTANRSSTIVNRDIQQPIEQTTQHAPPQQTQKIEQISNDLLNLKTYYLKNAVSASTPTTVVTNLASAFNGSNTMNGSQQQNAASLKPPYSNSNNNYINKF